MNVIDSIEKNSFDVELLRDRQTPLVITDLVSDWPVVKSAKQGDAELVDYLTPMDRGLPLPIVSTPAENNGRIFYTDDMLKLNSTSERGTVSDLLNRLLGFKDDNNAPLNYIGTAHCPTVLNGFDESNDIDFSDLKPDQFMWLGNRSCISAHYDIPDNLACNVAGRRKVTLFPPEQIDNLYVGPLDFTPAGQSISLVNIRQPDLDRFPKYVEAQKAAFEIVLNPGDALYIPSLWWHHIEGLDDINILVNYWWRTCSPQCLSPLDAMSFAIASIRDLPPHQRTHWRRLYERYVFEPEEEFVSHIPPMARGSLGVLTDNVMRRLRAKIISRLNR